MRVHGLKHKQWKQKRRQQSSLQLREDFRLREVMLYLLLCDINLLLCQYNNDENLKNAFDAIFVSADIPKTVFPAMRFRMLSALLEQATVRKTSNNSNDCCSINVPTKDALLCFSALSPILSSCAIKEMNAFHAFCHLKKLPMSVLMVLNDDNIDGDDHGNGNPQGNHHDLRNLRNCIAEYARAVAVGQGFATRKAIALSLDDIRCDGRCGEIHRGNNMLVGLSQFPELQQLLTCRRDLCNQQQKICDFQGIQFDAISPRAKLLLFLISTLPAFLKISNTRDIRYLEVLRLLSRAEKDSKLRTAAIVHHRHFRGDNHGNETESKSSTLTSPFSPLPPTPSVNIWEI